MNKPFISIIMPAYNEGERIYDNLLETVDVISSFAESFEIIAINDGSADETYTEICRAAEECRHIIPINHENNEGKGHALRLGTARSKGELVAFMDSDLDLHPRQLKTFLTVKSKNKADVVIGSKMHPDSQMEYPISRRVISWGYFIVLKILFGLNVHDTQTGMKLFDGELIRDVMKRVLVKRFAFDIEVLTILNKKKKKIVEAPIILQYGRETSWSRIGIKDIWHVMIDTFAVFYRLNILHYYDKEI